MISSLSRHIPRATASVTSFKCIRPTVGSSPILTSSSRAFSSSSTEPKDDQALSRDAIGEIISAEYGLTMAESKRVVRTVFDTITEVRLFFVSTCFVKCLGCTDNQQHGACERSERYLFCVII